MGIVIGIIILYFIPFFIAMLRKHPNSVPIALVNVFFGWTILGWIIALIWSFTAHPKIAKNKID